MTKEPDGCNVEGLKIFGWRSKRQLLRFPKRFLRTKQQDESSESPAVGATIAQQEATRTHTHKGLISKADANFIGQLSAVLIWRNSVQDLKLHRLLRWLRKIRTQERSFICGCWRLRDAAELQLLCCWTPNLLPRLFAQVFEAIQLVLQVSQLICWRWTSWAQWRFTKVCFC